MCPRRGHRGRLAVLLALLAGGPLVRAGAQTQPRPAYLDIPAEITMVGTPKPGTTYPLLVFLPFTTGDARTYREYIAGPQVFDTFVALVPAGTVRQEHYLPDFGAFVSWYEERLLRDIAAAEKALPVDASRVYLQGYSLGGDLAWALMVRRKELFAGALVIGSRCSWPIGAGVLESWKEQGRRIAFLIGAEDTERMPGMKAAADKALAAGVRTRYGTYPGAHTAPRQEDLADSYAFLFGTGESSSR